MRRSLSLLTLIVTSFGISACAWADEIFPDPNLRAVIKGILEHKQIKKETIEVADLKTIYFLDACGKGIKDLTGLENCIHLAEVKLNDNEIEKLEPLSKLENIQSLYLSRNKLTGLAPLQDLVKLQYLEAEHNQIASLAGLEKLTNMRALYLANNKISDLAPLSGMKKLASLDLAENSVSDLKPLQDLPWVSTLKLTGNKVADLSPISGYTDLHFLFLQGNPLSDLSVLVEMARKDVEGPRRFAPYLYLYVDADKLPAAAGQQLEELKQMGVRVNQKG